MIKFRVVGAERTAASLTRKRNAVNSGLKSATILATDLVRQGAERRILMPRRLNAQDSSAPRNLSGRRPLYVRLDSDGMAGYVGVRTHWTPARTAGAFHVFSKLGKEGGLVRNGLWINPQNYVKGADGKFAGHNRGKYENRDGLKFIRFSRHPNLLPWALKANKGRQLFRHAVRMTKDALEILVALPALLRNKSAIKDLYAKAVLRGILA